MICSFPLIFIRTMSKRTRIIIYLLLGLVIIIQFIPVDLPENKPPTDNDIMIVESIPDNISIILSKACYDCHSNQVKYPWYSYVAPVSWLVARDVRLGVPALNLSEWGAMTKRQKLKSLDQIGDAVKSGTMPFPVYKITHPEARLTEEQTNNIVKWTEKLTEKVFEE